MLIELQLSVNDGHDGTVYALLRRVVALFEDIEVGGFILTALYVLIVVIATQSIVGFEVGIGTTRIVHGVGKTACIRHVAVLLTLVGEDREAQLQYLVNLEVALQRHVIAVVLHALHDTLLLVVACRSIVM